MLSSSVLAATTNIQANICDQFLEPTISSPVSGAVIEESSVVVTGTGEPGMTVTIHINDQNVGSSTILPDGSYALAVSLVENSNAILAREVNECGTIKDSTGIIINHLVERPVVPPSEGGEVPSSSTPLPILPESPVVLQSYSDIDDLLVEDVKLPVYSKPTIESPTDGSSTNNSSAWVAGSATPGSVVTIYVNDQAMAHVVASDTGKYYVLVGLYSGENLIRVVSELNGQSATSGTIRVIYQERTESTGFASFEKDVTLGIVLGGASVVTVTGALWWLTPRLQSIIRGGGKRK